MIQQLINLMQELSAGQITPQQFIASATPLLTALNVTSVNPTQLASIIQLQRQSTAELEEQYKNAKALADTGKDILDVEEKRLKYNISLQEQELERKRIAFEADRTNAALSEEYRDQLKIVKDLNDELDDVGRARGQGKRLANLLGISEDDKNSLTYQLFHNPKGIMDGFNKEVEAAGGLMAGLSTSLIMKVQEATVAALYEQDKAISSFVAATGATAEYNSIIYDTARGNTALGISFAESGKAVTDLYTNLNTFTRLTKSAQQELTVTTAKLEMLGISGGETANSIATLSEMMKISEVQAAKVVEEFAAMGQAIGVSSKQMISDFAGVKDQLAVFGNDMNKVFTDLEAQSKATGVAVSDLLNLANKFDTFGSAADSVGKLNAMLGGPYLSTMAMIESTDPTERIDMLRQAVNNAGIAFDEMSYYEKKAIMEAGGFKTVEEAQRVLSMSAGAYADQLKNQSATQKELNDAIERAQPIQDKLTKAMANFAIVMGPLVDILSGMLTVLVELLDNPIGRFITTMLVVVAVSYKVVQAFTAIRTAVLAMNLAMATSPFGLAVIALSAAVGGLYYLFMQKRSSPTLYEFFLMLPKMFALMAGSALIFASSLMIISGSLPLLSLGLLGLSLAIMSFANPIVLVGIYALGKALSTIVDQINEVETDKIINFKVMMEKVVEISQPDNMAGFQAFKENFEAVAKATAEFEVKKAQSFTTLLTATQNLSQNLQLKQDIKVLVDSQAIAARIEKKQGNAAVQGV